MSFKGSKEDANEKNEDDTMDWEYFLGKIVFVQLKKGDRYTGKVINIGEGFILVLDKFNERVALALSEIVKIKEETNHYKQLNLEEGEE